MRVRLIVTAAVACSTLVTAGAHAAPILDQVYEPTGIGGFVIGDQQTLAQTFKPGVTGTFASFEVDLGRSFEFAPALGVDWELRRLSNRKDPNAPAIASGTIDPSAVGVSGPGGFPILFEFVTVDLSSLALPVRRGAHYALVLSTADSGLPGEGGANPYGWRAGGGHDPNGFDGAGYNRGLAFVKIRDNPWSDFGTLDFGFRTIVEPGDDVPEPSLALLFVLAGASMARQNRKRRS